MQTVTTKAIAKVAAVATGLAMATSMLSFAPMAQAAALTSSQISAIVSLLQSFGADAATIANVQASLTGGTPSGTTTTTTTTCSFTKNLTVGSKGDDVKDLQEQLKAQGFLTANATGFFGSLTKAAVIAWQKEKGISPALGFFGPKSRAAFTCTSTTTTTTGGTTGGTTTGTGLKVSLATDSPNGVALVQGQAAAELGKFTFSNPTATPVNVTGLSFKRIGVSNDSTMTNVYLYTGAVRLTDSAGVSGGAFNFNNAGGIFSVPAGGSFTVSVRSDIATGSSGQQIGVQLVSAASSGTLDASVVFPVTGGLQTISAATLATVDFNTTTLPSATTADPQADYTVWQNTVTIGTRAVLMKSLALRNIGSVQSGDIVNFRLYVDGIQAGSAVAKVDANNLVTFDLSANPVRLETGGRVLKVVADIVGGASRTFQASLRYAADALFYDTDLNQPVLATAASASFSARSATSATINSITTSAPSVTKATDSPTAAVANGSSNVKWATFKIIANGEDVKVDNLNVFANTSVSNGGLDNGKVFVNGVQVGSTKDLTEGPTDTNFTFGSSFIVKVGTVATVDIYADAKTSTSTNLVSGETVQIVLDTGSSNGQGQVSLASVNIPATATTVSGNTITVSSSSLSATKASYYGNQTVIAGAQNVKVGAFTLSAGSTEGVNVNTIELAFTSSVTSTLSDISIKDHDTGTAFGTSKPTVGTTNSFSGSASIAKSGTKTFDVFANVKSAANAGAIPAMTVSTNTTGTGATTGSSVSVGTAATLQTITVGTAALTVAQNAGSTPDNAIVVAPKDAATAATQGPVKVGSFRFTSQFSSFKVDQIAVKVPANAATAVSAVVLQYKDEAGATQTASQALTLSSGAQTHATATFTGLTFFVPADTNRDLDVFVTLPTIASAPGASGKSITALLDYNEGFNAADSSGATITTPTSSTADFNSAATTGKGTMVVRKSVPTLAAGTPPSTTLNTGSDQVLGTFNVTADAAGDVDWGQVVFTVNKTAAITIGATTTLAVWDVTSGATQVAGTFATSTDSTVSGLDALVGRTSGLLHFRPTTVQTVGFGTTRKYELRGTVGGTAAGANNVSVSIAAPSTSATTDIFSTVAGTLGTAANPSFVWSDWSDATDHASSATGGSTTDWANEFLVKTVPVTIGNRSLNF